MVQTGLWLDPDGCGHVFPDEVCAEMGFPYDQEHYDLIVQVVREGMAARGIPVRMIQHVRKEDA